VSHTERARQITGKISANPNPVFFGQGNVVISWETSDPAGGEVRVSTAPGDEKLVSKSKKQSGHAEIPWIVDSTIYDFRLYAASQPDNLIDSVRVRRAIDSAPMALRELADEVMRGNIETAELCRFVATAVPACFRSADFQQSFSLVLHELAAMREKIDIMEFSQFIATVMPHFLYNGRFHEVFCLWQRHGFHVTPVHFYEPIPNTESLPEKLWDQPSKLAGIEMNDAEQLELLREQFPKFRDEYECFPTEPLGDEARFYLTNGLFDGTDALVAYCMIRHFQPRLIIEIGSGFSSLLAREAIVNGSCSRLLCIEPFPRDFLRQQFPGADALVQKNVQDVDLAFFSQLASGDILFIDSSHTVKIGGDVNYLFLEVLPRLNPGVIVHVHDISFPFDYRRKWVVDQLRFWNEQYLLQAFLAFNSEFEVLMANNYLAEYYLDDLKAAFPNSPWWGGGSFWMRRRLSRAQFDRHFTAMELLSLPTAKN
jgi:Methyltransferase domain